MKARLLSILAGLAILSGSTWAVEKVEARVAILSFHEPRDISYHVDLRRELYETWSLRGLRFLERLSGWPVDDRPWGFSAVALGLLLLASILIFIGFFYRRAKRGLYITAALILVLFGGWIFLFTGVASLNQYDMKGVHHIQKILDVTTAWGERVDTFQQWTAFSDAWTEERQPYTVVAWMGLPHGAEELKVESWLSQHRDRPMLHVCMGANLPKMFHEALFGSTNPTLDWAEGSGRSVSDLATAYGRRAMWRTSDEVGDFQVKLVPWGEHWVLYVDPEISSSRFGEWLARGRSALKGLPWGRLRVSGTAALRLDDPGTSLNYHLESWRFPTLSVDQWQEIHRSLTEMDARMTIGYVPGWLDDGDKTRGDLFISGELQSDRVAGKVYPSTEVVLRAHGELGEYRLDAQSEFFKTSPNFELQLHGHTHISPEVEAWLKAKDRYENVDWYREFLVTERRPFEQRSSEKQLKVIRDGSQAFLEAFGYRPSIMIPPGHAVSWNSADLTFEEGFVAMAGRHLVMNDRGKVRRTRLVPTLDWRKVDEVEGHRAELMTIMLHDRDFALEATSLEKILEPWVAKGYHRFVSVGEMVAMLQSAPTLSLLENERVVKLQWPTVEEQLLRHPQRSLEAHWDMSVPDGMELLIDDVSLEGFDGKAVKLTWVPSPDQKLLRVSYGPSSKFRELSIPFQSKER